MYMYLIPHRTHHHLVGQILMVLRIMVLHLTTVIVVRKTCQVSMIMGVLFNVSTICGKNWPLGMLRILSVE
jgi:hypothetical protein